MNKQPDRWITVLNADTGEPAPGVPLVYTSIRKPYFIVGAVMISREYISDMNGKAHVPSGVRLQAAPGSNYVDVPRGDENQKNEEPLEHSIIYVKTYEQYIKKWEKTEQPAGGDAGSNAPN